MMRERTPIFLSFSDLSRAVLSRPLFILASALFFAALSFGYFVTRPVSYTAEGIYKSETEQSQPSFAKALEMLGGNDSYFSNNDLLGLVGSYPVLERVVRDLNLQACLVSKDHFRRFKQIAYTFQTEKTYHHLKHQQVPSHIHSKSILISPCPIVPDPIEEVTCQSLDYPGETTSLLQIQFVSPTHYTVRQKDELLGEGTLGTPFMTPSFRFTLVGIAEPGKTLTLGLIPLEGAILRLKARLKITKDKEMKGCAHLLFTHHNRHLAARVVNATMYQLEHYLQTEAEKKIHHQIAYLQKRQHDSATDFEKLLDQYRDQLQTHLGASKVMSVDKELEFFAAKESQLRRELDALQTEIERTEKALAAHPVPFETIEDENSIDGHTLDSVHHLLRDHQYQLNSLQLKDAELILAKEHLEQPDFDPSSLIKTLSDPSLGSRFEKLHQLHHHLVDQANWTPAELTHFQKELETERAFLRDYICHAQHGISLQENALLNKIYHLQSKLAFLLNQTTLEKEREMQSLAIQAAGLPERWVQHQKLQFQKELSQELMSSITKMIEAKNIGYHLDYLSSRILKKASPPFIPNKPRLLIGEFMGMGAGILLALLFLCVKEVWKGPSASPANLSQLGYHVLPQKETLSSLGYELAEREGPYLLVSEHPTLAPDLAALLSKRGLSVSLEILRGDRLHIDSQKKQILYVLQAPVQTPECSYWSRKFSTVFYGIVDERLQDLTSLPSHTLFYYEKKGEEMLTPLQQVGPLLLKLFSSVFGKKRVSPAKSL